MLAGIYGFAVALILIMRLVPRSPLGRILLEQLADRPIRWLSGLERHQVIAFILLGPMLLGGGEAIALFGPELFMAYVIDLSIYLDVMAVSVTLAAVARSRNGWQAIRAQLSRARPGKRPRNRRARRTPRVHRPRASDNDDEPAGDWRRAA